MYYTKVVQRYMFIHFLISIIKLYCVLMHCNDTDFISTLKKKRSKMKNESNKSELHYVVYIS